MLLVPASVVPAGQALAAGAAALRASEVTQLLVAGIEAAPVNAEILAAFSQPVSGRVEVETEMISPALLVLRSAGLNADTAPLVSRP